MSVPRQSDLPSDDTVFLQGLGIKQELDRSLNGFSNFALSFSIICILAGGITSFHLGFGAVGGGALGIGWPIACVVSLIVAATMGQLASAFPTAGGLYHWAAILGGRGFGWVTAWLNLAGLITVLAAINVGTFLFAASAIAPMLGINWEDISAGAQLGWQALGVTVMTLSQGIINQRGIRVTARLTDFSGYLILAVAFILTLALLIYAPTLDFERLWTFTNNSGSRGGDIWPASKNIAYLFLLALLLPAYTITGFDASAHVSEETLTARHNVPRGIVRSVVVSAIAGWLMVCAIVLAMPDMEAAAGQGAQVFFWVMKSVLPSWLNQPLLIGIALAQYLCGLATVTSASRMMFAFARDGGLPFSKKLAKVSSKYFVPVPSIWTVVVLAVAFTLYVPVYSTMTVVCAIFLYLSYVLPVAIGFFHHGKSWNEFGPWHMGAWYKPAALLAVIGCITLIWIGVQPPNDKALIVLAGLATTMALLWFGFESRRFMGPSLGNVEE